MGREFSIYVTKCKTDALMLGSAAADLMSYARRLDNVKSAIRSSSSSYGNIVGTLEQILSNVYAEQKALKELQQTLTDCADAYAMTEKRIAGVQVNDTKSNDAENAFQWEDLVEKYEEGTDNNLYLMLSTLLKDGILKDDVRKAALEILSGTYLMSHKINGIEYLKVVQKGMINSEIGEWLHNRYGGDWSDYLARNMKDYKLGIYNDSANKYMRAARYFDDVTDKDLWTYIKNIKEPITLQSISSDFGKNLINDFDYRDWGELGKLGKVGKVLGTAGTVLTIGTDVFDNFYDSDTKTWSFSGNQLADCTADVAIDLSVGAGAAAAGAAVGSLIVPPVGTVVGAGVGLAIGVATNLDFYDFDGDGEKDSLVDGAKIGMHALIDGAGDWLSDVFSF